MAIIMCELNKHFRVRDRNRLTRTETEGGKRGKKRKLENRNTFLMCTLQTARHEANECKTRYTEPIHYYFMNSENIKYFERVCIFNAFRYTIQKAYFPLRFAELSLNFINAYNVCIAYSSSASIYHSFAKYSNLKNIRQFYAIFRSN